MSVPSTFSPDTHVRGERIVSLVGATPQPRVCGTFVRGTITGRVLKCGYSAGHGGDHERTRPKTRRVKNRTRPGILR
jgi:hypothetical protein